MFYEILIFFKFMCEIQFFNNEMLFLASKIVLFMFLKNIRNNNLSF